MRADLAIGIGAGSQIHYIEIVFEQLGEFAEIDELEEVECIENVPVVVYYEQVDVLRVVGVVLKHIVRARIPFTAFCCAEMIETVKFKGNLEILRR